eukprot:5115754-Pyramimonas_sp.AAC.1
MPGCSCCASAVEPGALLPCWRSKRGGSFGGGVGGTVTFSELAAHGASAVAVIGSSLKEGFHCDRMSGGVAFASLFGV